MRFGTKVSEVTSKSSAGGSFIKYFKNGDTRLRFLEEIDDWTEYYEHFSNEKNRSFPCTGDRENCPGCRLEASLRAEGKEPWGAQKRYLVNCFDPDSGYVNLYKMPVSIKDDLDRYSDKDGTICARDYTVARYKKADDKIAYSVDREEKDPIDLSKYSGQLKDHQQMLSDAYIECWGALPGDDGSSVKAPEPKEEKKPAPEPEKKPELGQGEPPTEPAEDQVGPSQESDDDQEDTADEREIEEDDLYKMSAGEIKALFAQCGLKAPETNDVGILASALITALES